MDPKAYENFKSHLQMELPSHSIGNSKEHPAQKNEPKSTAKYLRLRNLGDRY